MRGLTIVAVTRRCVEAGRRSARSSSVCWRTPDKHPAAALMEIVEACTSATEREHPPSPGS